MHASNEPIIRTPTEKHNDVSISDAETQSGSEHAHSDNEKEDEGNTVRLSES